jgi:hypothetical protein
MKKLSRIEAMVYNRMLTQFLEWTGTGVVIIGALANSLGYHPEGPYLMIAGGLIWVLVGTRWKKMSIVVTNSVITLVSTFGLLYYYFT